jgi:glucokinase
MPDFSIGVDLGGTNLRIAAICVEGELLEKVTLATKLALGRDHVIDEMCEAIQHLSNKYKSTGNFLGVGAGIPGLMDVQTGVVRKAVNLPGWENYPVRAEIERRLGSLPKNAAPVVLDNDGRVAALGEQWLGAGRGVQNLAMITLGTGIGGGIVIEGRIWHGMSGMAGEFGHVTIDPEGPPCGCGNRGCAEQYASASAIMRMAREAVASGEAPALAQAAASDAGFGAQAIYALALQGDEEARRIFRTVGRALGILLSDMVNILNFEMFVIGGGVVSAWDAFAPSMFEELRRRSVVYAATAPSDSPQGKDPSGKKASSSAQSETRNERRTIVTRALLGSDAGLYGAARAAVLAG